MSDKRRQANRGEGLPSFSDNQYSVAEADPEAFSEPICIAYVWPVGNDAHAWLLTFTDSARVHLGRSSSLAVAKQEIPAFAKRYGYDETFTIERAPSEAYGQPRPEEVARA